MYYLISANEPFSLIAWHTDKEVVQTYIDIHQLGNHASIFGLSSHKEKRGNNVWDWINQCVRHGDFNDLYLRTGYNGLPIMTHTETKLLENIVSLESPLDIDLIGDTVYAFENMKKDKHPHYLMLNKKGKKELVKTIKSLRKLQSHINALYDVHTLYDLIGSQPKDGDIYQARTNEMLRMYNY